MRNSTMVYTSSDITDLATYEDLLGHHFLSIRNLTATSPVESYRDSSGESYRDSGGEEHSCGYGDSEWDYSSLWDPEAFKRFLAIAD